MSSMSEADLAKAVGAVLAAFEQSGPEKGPLKLRMLSNMYNSLLESSPLRRDVFVTIVALLAQAGQTDLIFPHLKDIEHMKMPAAARSVMYKKVIGFLSQSPTASKELFDLQMKYLELTDEVTADFDVVTKTAADAIKSPSFF